MALIRAVLKTDKKITRNWCLNRYPRISRLGSLIKWLEYDDWKFDRGYINNRKDYEYRIIKIGK